MCSRIWIRYRNKFKCLIYNNDLKKPRSPKFIQRQESTIDKFGEQGFHNSPFNFTRLQIGASCILTLLQLVLTLGASVLTLYSSNEETHNFARITLRFLFQGEKKKLHKTSLVFLEGLDPPQTVMKRNALSHRAARLREPVLRHPIPNAWSRDQFFFFFF